MGLGKTIEIIDLILMNPRPPQDYNCDLPIQGEALRPSKATVIITPPTIRILHSENANSAVSQWAGEFAERAPTLKVFIYPGVQHLSVNFNTDDFLDYDVILATYPILSKEIHYATPPPDRSMRYGQVHPARRSPLMEFSWWRVCLDEAQMIEGSVTSAATVACMLPRIVSTRQNWELINRTRGVFLGRLARGMFLIFTDYSSFSATNQLPMRRHCGPVSVTTGMSLCAYFGH
jgi:E3 ubiquitin-protein ligase SHPRH